MIERIGLTTIRLGFPSSNLGLVLVDYLDTVIRTSAIKDKVLQVRIVLADDTQDGLLKKLSLVKGRRNNGNLRPNHDWNL